MVKEDLKCYHCGQPCEDRQFLLDEKNFCCYGCQVVFEIINDNNLCTYYEYGSHPGATGKYIDEDAFAFLGEEKVQQKLLKFRSESFAL